MQSRGLAEAISSPKAPLWLSGILFALASTLMSMGCSHGLDYPHAAINGTVLVDGKLVDKGSISYFSDVAGRQQVGKADIIQGHYEISEIPLGPTTFTFSASADTGKMTPGPGGVPEPERINLIPQKYSSEGITRSIEGDGLHDFEIDSSLPSSHGAALQ